MSATLPSHDSTHNENTQTISRKSSDNLDGIRRSVSFLERVPEQGPMDPEGSADENTAIIQRLRGGKRSYDSIQQGSKSSPSPSTRDKHRRQPSERGSTRLDGSGDAASDKPPKLSWWKNVLDKYGTIELQNKGSVARDHLALERTFLAWLRTSLSFASIGVAVTQLFRLDQTLNKTAPDHPRVEQLRHVGKPLGATFLGVGILVLLIAFHRYFESQHYIMLGKFPASRGSVAIVAFCAGALTVASLAVVLSIAPDILT